MEAPTDGLERIGSYVVTRLLARTDLSEVYAARDVHGRAVCIKRLLPSLAVPGSAVALSFRREAALLAEVRHPNVVHVLEVGEERGVPFTCLELIEGRSLEDRIGEGPLALAEAAEILRQIAVGLARVHERGILHADLKPANVLLRPVPSGIEVKLADFGLASEAAGQSGGISGTPHYMAPEQTRLVDWPVDARTDMYSLGVLAFKALTGTLPFDASDPAALFAAHVSQKPPRPSDRRPALPPIVDRIVLKLLEKNPAHRYRSALSLSNDLETLLDRLRKSEASPEFALDSTGDLAERVGQVFVGREIELTSLDAALERARAGRPQVVFVGGVAGVGKSTLLREFQNRSLAAGAQFAMGKCYEFARGLPYYVLAEALGDHLRRLGKAPETDRSAIVERVRSSVGDLGAELVKMVPAYAPLFPEARESVYLGEGRDRVRFLQMFGSLLEALAAPGSPLVLLLDDLQWADGATLQVLDTVVDAMKDSAVLLLATFRSEEVNVEHPFHRTLAKTAQKPNVARIDLRPFDRNQTATMVAESLRQPGSSLPGPMLDTIHARTEGNPLFVSEVLKALLGSGAISMKAGRLAVSMETLERTKLPGSVVDIVLRRLEGLDVETRNVLGTAAFVGKGFTLGLLASASGVTPEAAFTAVGRGLAQQVLQAPRDGTYRFHHDRVQEACALLVAESERPEVHLRIVRFFEESGAAERDDDTVFELAEHAALAHDAERTWRYGRRAAERAKVRYANDQALEYFRRALGESERLAGVAPSERRSAREKLAEVLDLLGRYGESIDETRKILADSLEPADRARSLGRLAESLQKSGDYPEAERCLEEALGLLGVRLGDERVWYGPWLARLRVGWALLRRAVLRPGAAALARVLVVDLLIRLTLLVQIVAARRLPYLTHRLLAEAIKLGPSRQLSIAHRIFALALAQLPRPPWARARGHGMRAVEIARSVGAHLEAGVAMVYTSDLFCWPAKYREALPWLEGARDALSALGNMWELANVHIFSYLAQRGCGRIDEALTHAQALCDLGERIGAWGTIANGHGKVAEMLFLRGEDAKAETHLRRSVTIAEERKLNFERYQAYKVQGAVRMRNGRFAEARAHWQAAIRLLETPGVSFFQAYVSDAYFGYAETFLKDADYLAATGGLEGEEGRRVARYVAEGLARERYLLGHLGAGLRVRAIWQARAGRIRASRRTFVRAIDLLRSQDRPVDVAVAELDAAGALGDRYPAEAQTWLRRAHSAFADRRLRPLVEQCDAAAARLGLAVPTQRPVVDDKATHALREMIQVSQLLMESRDPSALLERIVDSSISLLGAERGFVFVRRAGSDDLVLEIGKTAGGQRIDAQDAQVSRGVIARVDRSGDGLAVSDTQTDDTLREQRSVMAFNLRSVLCTPLHHASERIGVLYLDSQVTQALFGPAELNLLQSFAAQASIALANAMQFSTIQDMNRDLDRKVRERTLDLESANVQLAASMDELRNTTLRLAEARREALEKELDVARTIQMTMVPEPKTYDLAGARFRGLLEPASYCGGDFWTFVEVPGRLLFLIGDVTGHGVGSAMITTVARACVDTLRVGQAGKLSLEEVMQTMNDVVYGLAREKMVMTAFAAEIEPATRSLAFCVAGHNPQYLLRLDEGREAVQIAPLFARGMRLGDGAGNKFPSVRVDYRPGDRLVLYTDGLVECTNPAGVEFGDRRFRRILAEHGRLGAPEILAKVDAEAKAHYADHPPADDITLVVGELK